MADMTDAPSSCCSAPAQAVCCEPSDKDACCGTSAASGTCGCSAGQQGHEEPMHGQGPDASEPAHAA